MKWFKKWFQGKCEKSTEEPGPSRDVSWLIKIDSLKHFIPEEVPVAEEALEVLDVYVPVPSDVCVLTTIKNFRTDSLKEFVYESEWVIVSRKQFMEPKFQRRLQKTDTLTDLCRSLAENSVNRRHAEVIAKPPNCHCHEMSSCESEQPLRLNAFRRALSSFKRFWRLLCRKVKDFKIIKAEEVIDVPNFYEEDPLESFASTNMYLCR